MNPHDSSPVLHGEQSGRDACRQALQRRPARNRAQCRLARQSDQDGCAEVGEPLQVPQQFKVVPDGLAETEARVERDALAVLAAVGSGG